MSMGAAIFLGFIQGVAEFLPISSSGHLSVLQNVFNFQSPEEGHMFFDVLLHLGTLVAIFAAYWPDIRRIVVDTLDFIKDARSGELKKEYSGSRLLLMMFFATLPLFVVLPINDMLESLYYKTGFIGAIFLLTGCMLYVSDRMPRGRKSERQMTVVDALLIGVCQAVATIPGLSRSGTTITAGIATGHERSFAVKFSLLLSIPAVIGANILGLVDAIQEGFDTSLLGTYFVGMLVAAVTGYFSIVLLRRIVSKGRFGNFAYYMWGAGVVTLIASLF
ncbi:MAG: undecaprenyl-diphosphate phosphatase [Ruminococcaceae bacterium]|nr:undecaprenyl-diphosphate phosphatase [Oscillospiraceae bacterium]